MARLVLRMVLAAVLAWCGVRLIRADRASFGERGAGSGERGRPVAAAVPGASDTVGGEWVRHPEDRLPEPEPEAVAAADADAPLADELQAARQARTTFRDPTVDETLAVLFKLVLAYNGERLDGTPGIPRGLRLGRPGAAPRPRSRGRGPYRLDTMPTAEQLQAWFSKLSYRERVAIDFRFHDPKRYEEFMRAEREKANRGDGDPQYAFAGGGEVKLFADPMNVFRSPRDGQPFRIAVQWRPKDPAWPNDPAPAPIIACEAEGIRRPNGTYLAQETRRAALTARGTVETLCEVDPE